MTKPTKAEIEAVAEAMWESYGCHDRPRWKDMDRALDADLLREFRKQARDGLLRFIALRPLA